MVKGEFTSGCHFDGIYTISAHTLKLAGNFQFSLESENRYQNKYLVKKIVCEGEPLFGVAGLFARFDVITSEVAEIYIRCARMNAVCSLLQVGKILLYCVI